MYLFSVVSLCSLTRVITSSSFIVNFRVEGFEGGDERYRERGSEKAITLSFCFLSSALWMAFVLNYN